MKQVGYQTIQCLLAQFNLLILSMLASRFFEAKFEEIRFTLIFRAFFLLVRLIKSPISSVMTLIHIASIAAGNNGIPVRSHRYKFGKASGMAPRVRFFNKAKHVILEVLFLVASLSVSIMFSAASLTCPNLNYEPSSI